ncbi:MAG TPA: helix-turn-helix domain-containing protein [Thermoanaerobaculia bacterium]|nr:helix-turn-helix domain-containing protein [Thermoanaerobaculia bacterium]
MLRSTPNPKAAPLLADGISLHEAVEAFERELIFSRLERHGGNVKAARESLGLAKATFHRYMKRLGIAVRGMRARSERRCARPLGRQGRRP